MEVYNNPLCAGCSLSRIELDGNRGFILIKQTQPKSKYMPIDPESNPKFSLVLVSFDIILQAQVDHHHWVRFQEIFNVWNYYLE